MSRGSTDSLASSSVAGSSIGSSAMSGSAVGRGAAPGAVPLTTAVPNHGPLCAELTQMGFNALQVRMHARYGRGWCCAGVAKAKVLNGSVGGPRAHCRWCMARCAHLRPLSQEKSCSEEALRSTPVPNIETMIMY
eukprot:scaffold176131_cov19-Tisochrysis_lutea.AAC.1